MTKLEQIQESVERNYSFCNKEEKKRIVRQEFAKWLVRGRTIGSRINPEIGKKEIHITGKSIALLI